jgi:hypothetical protein
MTESTDVYLAEHDEELLKNGDAEVGKPLFMTSKKARADLRVYDHDHGTGKFRVLTFKI